MNGQEIYQEQYEVKEVLKKAPQKIYSNGVAFAYGYKGKENK